MAKKLLLPFFLLLSALSTYFLQTHMFLNGDVGSLLYDTRLFLQGGTYIHDFLETNPPMIFIIYSPVIFLEKWTSLNIVMLMRIYIIFSAFLSIGLSNILLKKIIKPSEDIIRYLLLAGLIFVFLFLPACEFGQREHFFLMLMMPYLFAAVLCAKQQKINSGLAGLIAVMAALGIGMKPYFLAPLIFVELYLMIIKKNILSAWRLEVVIIVSLLMVYLGWIFICYPTYIYQMLPLISDLYFISIKLPWSLYFSALSISYCTFVMILCLFTFNKLKKYRELMSVLLWAFIGMLVAVTLTRASWYYHVFPALALSVLLLPLFVFLFFSNHLVTKLKKQEWLGMVVSIMVPLYLFIFGIYFGVAVKKHSDLNKLIAEIHQQKHLPSVYCFSANTTGDCFTLVYFSKSHYGGRYPFFWWLRGLRMIEMKAQEEKKGILSAKIQKDKIFLMNAVAEDLQKAKPDWLIINTFDEKNTLNSDFDFANYFSQNDRFRVAWSHYHYLKKVGIFDVYQRS